MKNTGKVDLINVSVDDDKLGHVGTIASLKVGESKTLTFNTHLPTNAGLLTNVGTAVGHDRFGRTAKGSRSRCRLERVSPRGPCSALPCA